ncbi:flagellar hook-associated protein FlgK [Mesobacterium sp. TK19101]|uniref:Flagellar hook-associated protein 1 n=1 Tax=Mesobacterium hydrothermale TaxID=3111907 RepID=A0ABU6HFP7_9RHOB|nr:flagellar hook-associated protein FlgK [Mesobacterium sp. TK19101]MEC3861285.1 flagellar hook-associated protein FlgK [Mesobacterium sp. TK19101]
MSLSGALSNAMSGISANARAASLVSDNIANALTPGYGRRELVTQSDNVATHGGVQVSGVIRHSDPVLLAERRLADAQAEGQAVLAGNAQKLEMLVGSPLDETSLTGLLDAFDASLISAAADPSATLRLTQVSRSALAISGRLNDLTNSVQSSRRDAEASIAAQVSRLNGALERIADLNTRISQMENAGQDNSVYVDQRQLEIDSVGEMLSIRVVARDRGEVAIFSTGGAVLLEGSPAQFAFTRANEIAPHMTQANGLLSGLLMNGEPVATGPDGRTGGGTLAAAFQIRDQETVGFQAKLDGLALDLAQRLGAGGPDSTLIPGDPGIFTDNGAAVTAADLTGLAGRLTLNAAVAPGAQTVWKLRDGLGASTPGTVGDAGLLNGYRDALSTVTAPTATALGGITQDAFGHFSDLVTGIADARISAERDLAFARGQQLALQEQELAEGVDTDHEMQLLLKIEQNYAANAQVIRVLDDLMQQLLQI